MDESAVWGSLDVASVFDVRLGGGAEVVELAGDVRRFGAAKDDASALAYVSAALRDDLELYDLLAAKLDDDLRACDALVL